MAELFQDFEINRLPWWEHVWRIIAGSLVLHFILVIAVLYIPGLREAVNIASIFSKAKYVDEAYDKTIIGERAVLINPNAFEYPPGYFQNPAMPPQTELAPQIIATPTPVPPPPPPPPRPARAPKVTPTPVAAASPAPTPAAQPSPSPKDELASLGINENMSKEEQDRKIDDIAAKSGVERPNEDLINKKPLKDWLANAKEKKDKNEINLTGQIEMIIEADVGPNGKLLNPTIVSKSGDPKLQELVTDFVSALSDSKALAFLKDIQHIQLAVSLNDTEVNVKVSSEVESPKKASDMVGGFNSMLLYGRFKKRGETEGIIYQNTKVSASGKQIVVNFVMPRKDVTDILTKLSTS